MHKYFSNSQKLYVDANILIYLMETTNEEEIPINSVFKAIFDLKISIFTSDITITECLNGAFIKSNEDLIRYYIDLFSIHGFINRIPLHYEILVDAARVNAVHNLKTVDAIHYSSALASHCDTLLTNDRNFKSSENLKVILFKDLK